MTFPVICDQVSWRMDPKAMLWNSPRPPTRQPQPGERLFEFLRGYVGSCAELRQHGEWGIESQFYQNEEFLISRRFDTPSRFSGLRPVRIRGQLMFDASHGLCSTAGKPTSGNPARRAGWEIHRSVQAGIARG